MVTCDDVSGGLVSASHPIYYGICDVKEPNKRIVIGMCPVVERSLTQGFNHYTPVGNWYRDVRDGFKVIDNAASPWSTSLYFEPAEAFLSMLMAPPRVVEPLRYRHDTISSIATGEVRALKEIKDHGKSAGALILPYRIAQYTDADVDAGVVLNKKPVKSGQPKQREAKSVVSMSMIVVDVDSGLTLENAIERANALGLRGGLHTTYRHEPEHHKFRIYFPYAAPATWAEYYDDASFFAHLFHGDLCVLSRGQGFYGPCVASDRVSTYRSVSIAGEFATREKLQSLKTQYKWVEAKEEVAITKSHHSTGTGRTGRPPKKTGGAKEGAPLGMNHMPTMYDDTKITLVSGGSATIEQIVRNRRGDINISILCPYKNDGDVPHSNPTGCTYLLRNGEDGDLHICCYGGSCNSRTVIHSLGDGGLNLDTGTPYTIENVPVSKLSPPSNFEDDREDEENTEPVEITPQYRRLTWTTEELTQNKDGQPQYLPFHPWTPGVKLTGYKSPMGSGKTEVMLWHIKEFLAMGWKVTLISPRRALAHGIHARAGGLLKHYREIKSGPLKGSHVVVLDSLERVTSVFDRENQKSIVVIDETDQTRRSQDSGTMTVLKSIAVFKKLTDICSRADRVLIASADLREVDIAYMMEHMGLSDKTQVELRGIRNTGPSPYNLTIIENEGQFLAAVWARLRAGNKLVIPCMSADKAMSTAEMIRASFPALNVRCVVARTILPDRETGEQEEIKTINDWAPSCDVLLYSPALQSGVSITVTDHFDYIMGWASTHVGLASDMMQMMHRVRSPKSMDLTMCVNGAKLTMRTPASFLAEHNLMSALNRKATDSLLLRAFSKTPPAYPENQLRWWAVFKAEQHNGGVFGGMLAAIQRECHISKVDVTVAEPTTDEDELAIEKELCDIRKEWCKKIDMTRLADISLADDIELEEKQEPKDRQAKDEIDKARILKFYGTDIETALRFDPDESMMPAVRTYAAVALLAHKELDVVAVASKANTPRPGKYAASRTVFIANHLKMAGLDILNLPKEPLSPVKAKELNATLTKYPKFLLKNMGFTPPKDAESRPFWFLKALLKSVGITLKSIPTRATVDGKQIRTGSDNVIIHATVEDMVIMSAAQMDRMRSFAKEKRADDDYTGDELSEFSEFYNYIEELAVGTSESTADLLL